MTKFYYSASTNLILWSSLKDEYEMKNRWPSDALELTDEQAIEFMNAPPEGKMRVAGADGLPAWADLPPPTQEELIANAEAMKSSLRARADAEIAWLQDAVEAGIATGEETALLAEWRNYRVLLMRVDTAAPAWPTPPERSAI